MYSNDREAYRQTFTRVWYKFQQKITLHPYETDILQVILFHPDYQRLLETPRLFQHQEFTLEENPFLHMGLHLAVREQIRTNRPQGIANLFQELNAMSEKFMNAHEVEHAMMTCLAKMLWLSQQNDAPPPEEDYLINLKKLKKL